MNLSEQSIHSIPAVAISSCLLGEPVRYDGGDKKQPRLSAFFQKHCQLISICPEVEMGLGVPRAPIEIVVQKQQSRLREVSEPHNDYTNLANNTAQRILQNIGVIDGWVFKARSPSCGLTDTPVFNLQGKQVNTGQGMFASHILTAMPWLPCSDETSLQRDSELHQFFHRISVLHNLNHWLATDRSHESLLKLEQTIRPVIEYLPEVQLDKLHVLLINRTESIDDRFYMYRSQLMHLLTKTYF